MATVPHKIRVDLRSRVAQNTGLATRNPKGLAPEPAGGTSGPPVLLLLEELGCWRREFGDGCVVGEEVDVDASYEFVS
jgi:hypothetical protein